MSQEIVVLTQSTIDINPDSPNIIICCWCLISSIPSSSLSKNVSKLKIVIDAINDISK